MVESKLVYTTDRKMGPLVNSLFVDEAYTDSEEVFNQTITEMNKSKKKGIIMGDKRAVRGKDDISTDDRISDMVGFIYSMPRTSKEVYQHLFNGDKSRNKRWTYITQLIKYGSDGIVFYNKKEGVWMIDPERKIAFVDLIQKIKIKRSLVYDREFIKSKRDAKKKAKSETANDVQSFDKTVRNISLPITSGKPVELLISIVGDSVIINMKVG